MDKLNLEDIFSDPVFNELVAEMPKKKAQRIDPEFEKFQEITDWIKNHEGKEPEKSKDLTERKLFSRLRGYREKPEMIKKLSEIDELKLLACAQVEKEEKGKEVSKSLEDILNEDSLFEEDSKLESLLDLSRYKRTINAIDKKSTRKKASHFERYEPIFKQVHREIASGQRQLKQFSKNANSGEGNNISTGNFYIDNGILLTVVRIYDSTGKEYIETRNRSLKVHVVYENGTENKTMTLLGLISNLYDKTRNGRIVTEIISDTLGETTVEERAFYQTTGHIYVAKSQSTDPEISKYHNLYKIGFAGESIEKRISNAENEATYLYAPVKIIASWEVQNFSARKLETALHHAFEDKQLQLSVPTANGKEEVPKEWYVVPLEDIEKMINELVLRMQS